MTVYFNVIDTLSQRDV